MYLKPKASLKNKNKLIIMPSISNMKTVFVQLLAIVAIVTVNAAPIETNCTTEFHSLLEQALEVKSHCKIKGFYDCCEVNHTMSCSHAAKSLLALSKTWHGMVGGSASV